MAVFTATALAAASLATAAIGTGLAVYGQVQAASVAKDTASYNAKLAESQALQNDMDARENLKRKRETNNRFLAAQRGQFAAAGVTIEGTPLEVQSESAGILELQALEMNRQAQNESAQLRAGGAAQRRYGAAAANAAYIGAGASLLSGVGNISASAYNFNQSGATTRRVTSISG